MRPFEPEEFVPDGFLQRPPEEWLDPRPWRPTERTAKLGDRGGHRTSRGHGGMPQEIHRTEHQTPPHDSARSLPIQQVPRAPVLQESRERTLHALALASRHATCGHQRQRDACDDRHQACGVGGRQHATSLSPSANQNALAGALHDREESLLRPLNDRRHHGRQE